MTPTAHGGSSGANQENDRQLFLPVSAADMQTRGWDLCDFVLVSADAYVDHPSFAAALLGRLLESAGYRVCILAQPDWKTSTDFARFGRPRLGFLVSGGAMDSMVALYTANNKPRSEDAYSPGGAIGHRPDRAVIKYVSKIRELYKGIPVIIGGIEASLRRFTHYDYWSNTIKHSILLDSKADMISYGMGEHSILEIARRLQNGEDIKTIHNIAGTVWRTSNKDELPQDGIFLPAFEDITFRPDAPADTEDARTARLNYCRHFVLQEQNADPINGKPLIEQSENRWVVQNPPALPLSSEEFDAVYRLPYQRAAHPDYNAMGGVPALEEVLFSLTSCRGCFGACAFCAIAFHQGRIVQARSHESLVQEAQGLTHHPQFKGYIHDVGGPTANFRQPACKKQLTSGACPNRQCLGTNPCPNVQADHSDYVALLGKLRAVPGVKKVFVRSGIRFDYVMLDKDPSFLKTLCSYHISGQLKVAPEHVSDRVLSLMRKSTHHVYTQFAEQYKKENARQNKKQYLVPYYIASHPGADLTDALQTALYLKKTGFVPDQVQDFYPTPGSLSTTMYATGLDPYTNEPLFVARGKHQRELQRALLQFNHPEQYSLVREALREIGRADLIGTTPDCLVPPETGKRHSTGRPRYTLDGTPRHKS